MKLLAAVMILLLGLGSASAQSVGPETGQPLPRFESLRFNKVNLRRGAGEDYPIAWVFQRRGLPIEVFQEYKDWRHIRDADGATGWIHKTQLGRARTALIREQVIDMRADPDDASALVAQAEPGVVLTLIACQLDWCRAKADGYRGWVEKSALWGVTEADVFGDD